MATDKECSIVRCDRPIYDGTIQIAIFSFVTPSEAPKIRLNLCKEHYELFQFFINKMSELGL